MAKKDYQTYKGLQRPLVFKMFKGRFIYWALMSVLAGIVAGMTAGAAISSLAGLITMIVVSFPLLFFTIEKQKKGLYEKRKDEAIFFIAPQQQNPKTKYNALKTK